MIRWHLKERLKRFRYGGAEVTGYRLAKLTGMTTPAVYKLLKKDTEPPARLDIATLDVLCHVLKCQPGDLLEYVPDAPRKDA